MATYLQQSPTQPPDGSVQGVDARRDSVLRGSASNPTTNASMAQKRKRDLNSGASGAAAASDSSGQRTWAKRIQTSRSNGSNTATANSDVNGGLMLPTPSSSSSSNNNAAAAPTASSGAGRGGGGDDEEEADELGHHTSGAVLMSGGGAHSSTPPQATTTSPAGDNLHQSPVANSEELMLPQPRSELDANEMRQANAVSEASAAAATAVAALAGAYPALSGTSTTALAGLEHPYAIPSHVPDRNPYLNPMFSKAPSPPRQGPKPPVGSEEWHKVRRDNHKEVERRRRETINEGINELAKIVPGCEKNKGSILQRAVSFIAQLKQNEQNNIEKWTLEKLLMEQAISELSNNVERLKHQYDEAVQEAQMWRKMCQDAGLTADKDDTAAAAAAADDDIARNGDAEA